MKLCRPVRSSVFRFSAVLFALSVVASGAFAAPVRVAGRVLNGTNNNKPAAGAVVQLVRPGIEQAQSVVLSSATTKADGTFNMGTPNLAADDLLTARILWQGYTYESPAYDGAGRLKEFGLTNLKPDELELTVFDSTTVPPPLSFTVHHVAITSEDRDLKCIERIVVENPASRTFIGQGKEGATIRLSLPAGAQNIELDPKIRDAKLVTVGGQPWVAKPITPQAYDNRNAIIVQYTLPWKRGGVDLSRKLAYPAKFFFMARESKDKKLIITAPKLGADKDTPLPIDGNQEMRIVNSLGPEQDGRPVFQAGTLVSMNVARPTNPLVYAFVAFVAALCVAVPLTLMRTRGAQNNAGKIAEPASGASVISQHYRSAGDATALRSTDELSPRAKSLIEEIAILDERWEQGEIEREAYLQQRMSAKQAALDAMQT